MVALQFEIMNVIKDVVNEILFDKTITKDRLVMITIIVSDVNKLKLFKNISSNDMSDFIKLNIIYSKGLTESGDVMVCDFVRIKISIRFKNLCNRCKKMVNW